MNNDFFNFCIQQPKAGQRQLDKPTFYRDFILDPQLNGPATFGTQLPSMTRIGPDITFTRTSSATFINQEGNIQVVDNNVPRFEYEGHRTNLRTFSEDFSNWGANQLTVSSDTAAAPNGSIVAEKLVEDTSSSWRTVAKTINIPQSGPYTYSVYLKPAGRNAAFLEMYNNPTTLGPFGSGTRYSYFNLTGNGSVFTTLGNITPSIQLVNDGWYRCSITAQASSIGSTLTVVGLASSNSTTYVGNYTGDGTSGLYAWGAQVEVGSTATPYISTGATPVTVSRPKGLLIEEQRANFVGQQNLFDNTKWALNFATLSAGSGIAGLSSFIIGDEDNVNYAYPRYSFPSPLLSATTYCFSCYIKKNPNYNNNNPLLRVFHPRPDLPLDVTRFSGIWFNQATGQVAQTYSTTTSSVSVQDFGTYYRASFTFNTQSTAVPTEVHLFPCHGTSGSGTLTGTFIEVAGIQVEQGTFPTSYIPTYGLSAIRAADSAVVDGSNFVNFYNNKEGTLLAEAICSNGPQPPGGQPGLWTLDTGLFAQGYSAGYGSATPPNAYRVVMRNGGSIPGYPFGDSTPTISAPVNVRTVTTITPLSVEFNCNNSTTVTRAAQFTVPVPNRLVLGLNNIASNPLFNYLNGHIRKVGYWPKRLSNTTLRALTLSSLALGKYFAEDASLYTGTGPGVEVTRTSSATYFASGGKLTTAYYNRPRFDYDPVTNVCKGLLIEEQRTNLRTNSRNFSVFYTNDLTLTQNQIGIDGKPNTAWLCTRGSVGNGELTPPNSALLLGKTVTVSVYLKNVNTTSINFAAGYLWSSVVTCNINLNTGTITQPTVQFGTPINFSSQIIPAGNGWYRCSITLTIDPVWSSVGFSIRSNTSNTSFIIDAAQVEEGTFPTSYIPTTNAQVTRTADTVQINSTNWQRIYNPEQGTFYTKVLPLSGSQAAAVIDVGDTYNSIHGIWKSGPGGDGSSGTSWNAFSFSDFLSANAQLTPLTANFVSTAGVANSGSGIAYTYGFNNFNASVNGSLSTIITQSTAVSAIPVMTGYNYLNGHVQTLEYYPIQLTNTQLTALTIQ